MATPPHDSTASIQRLIHVTAHGEAVFHAAVAAARGDEARALLLDRAYRLARAAAALRAIARAHGIELSAGAEFNVLPEGDDMLILRECARREDRVIIAFRDALEETLPTAVRRTIERELDVLLARVGSLRALRDRLARRVLRELHQQAL